MGKNADFDLSKGGNHVQNALRLSTKSKVEKKRR